MSRDEGFSVMDVSADIVNDPKWRKLQRIAPDHLGDAFIAYVATLGASWKAGRRVSVEDAWPVLLAFNPSAIEAMQHVGLIDRRGLVTTKAWQQWFGVANDRRRKARDRWARYNSRRDADTTPVPRGSDAGTATSVPPSRPPVPPSEAKRDGTPVENGRASLALVEPSR